MSKKKRKSNNTNIYCHPVNRDQIDQARGKTSFSRFVVRSAVEAAGGDFHEKETISNNI